ncbi:hypothetical protein ACFPL7_12175 [Dongia soli]|uniref:Uncharacterized protein n=1 Tax=Dongia soli TaxID=600628 RepID=A0ABU5EG86_9PROT|nr:hypothetical protein [Dongia soli]MDY0885430.1 hypothetical protein [Dongia soli]
MTNGMSAVQPRWNFEALRDSDVETEPTQRDQFNNDDVGLADALVREVIQNSSDAARENQQVKVRFSFRTLENKAAGELRELFGGLTKHLQSCNLDCSPFDQQVARILVIEDFNTTGLTGNYDAFDKGNFTNFWRRHGRSAKGGQAGGRWGLGKLVFSSSSRIRTFFGLTLRDGDNGPLAMAQAVLSVHEIDGERFPAHGFWFANSTPKGLQLPVTDAGVIARLRTLLGFVRENQTGLSVVIPYVHDGINEAAVIAGVINNYYFQILDGRLVAEVGDTVIDKKSFHQIAAGLPAAGAGIPFAFVEAVSEKLKTSPDLTAAKPVGKDGLEQSVFDPETLKSLKSRFAAGEMIHARIPVQLSNRDGSKPSSYFDLFLKMLPENAQSFALFARGPITLVGERRYFQGSPAYGALVARDPAVAAFLGDAENPAHTAWNSHAEKLEKNWRNPAPVLAAVRHSLRHFYDLIAERIEREDPDALIDFFSLPDKTKPARVSRRKTPPARLQLPPRQKAIIIKPQKGGFELTAGPGAAAWTYPRNIRIRVAYDIIGADPFKRHSPFDFDFTKGDISLSPAGATVAEKAKNVLVLEAADSNFRLEAAGFDENRDIVVDARAQA